MTVDQLDVLLLVGAVVLLVSIAAVRLSVGSGLPVAAALPRPRAAARRERDRPGLRRRGAGPGARLRRPGRDPRRRRPDHPVGQASGRSCPRRRRSRPSAPRCPCCVIGVAAHLLLDVDWREAMLIGAVLAPTDSAAVFSVLRRVPLPSRIGGLLEAESGFNDAPVVILVVTLAGAARPALVGAAAGLIVYELLLGRRHRAGRRAGSARGGCDGSRCRRPASTRWRCSRCA